MKNKPTYLDYASTTPVSHRVLKAMQEYFSEKYGNPSSLHYYGRQAQNALDEARTDISKILNCSYKEIIFTSSATESINMIINSAIKNSNSPNPHIITTSIEHSAVLQSSKETKAKVSFIQPDKNGLIKPSQIEELLTDTTVLVSIAYANNEIGTIQPIKEIAEILKNHKAIFHTDATQAAGYCNINTQELGIDAMTISSHKIYGPKGAGILFIKENYPLHPIIVGGKQESAKRAGTENIPAIVGLKEALKETEEIKEKESERQKKLRDLLTKQLLENKEITLNGSQEKRLPNNININIENIKSDIAIAYLDNKGICISSGSACTSNTPQPSYVLKEIKNKNPQNGIRITIGRNTKESDIHKAYSTIKEMIKDLS